MKNRVSKLVSLFLLSSIIVSCNAPTTIMKDNNTNSNVVDNKTTSKIENSAIPNQATPVKLNKATTITFTQKEGKTENPIGPENISSVVVNGVTINSADIKIKTSSFTTKAVNSSDYEVTYEGAGKYSILNTKTGDIIENKAIIAFNLLNAKDPAIIPILSGVLDNNLKMTYDLASGSFYGGIKKEDGSIDNTKPVFKVNLDGKLIISDPDGKQTTFDRKNLSTSTNTPDPEKTISVSKEEIKKQIDEVSNQVLPTSPIADYVGLWLYQGLGQKIILSMKDIGNSKFEASTTILGEKYTGQSTYNADNNSELILDVPQDSMKIKVVKIGNNSLQLSLLSTSNVKFKLFQGAPVNLNRVRTTD
ncbi:MAG: hypothetical protein U0457_08980 [Candidatus Sericytochromatia bacterium]